MGNRLSKIYTRTGDDGTTGLGDGSRTDKDSLRVEAFGTVDELNALIGLVQAQDDIPENISARLHEIQHQLFDLGSELCIPDFIVIQDTDVQYLEQTLDALNERLPSLREFILPGGSASAAHCHHARTVCRRAERRVLSLARVETVNPAALRYLNRLSDLLFVVARTLARQNDGQEVLWNRERDKS